MTQTYAVTLYRTQVEKAVVEVEAENEVDARVKAKRKAHCKDATIQWTLSQWAPSHMALIEAEAERKVKECP